LVAYCVKLFAFEKVRYAMTFLPARYFKYVIRKKKIGDTDNEKWNETDVKCLIITSQEKSHSPNYLTKSSYGFLKKEPLVKVVYNSNHTHSFLIY